ncbi:hypothetical protein [Zobellella iuensis]|uniref:Uncharacterized protein n=1 Tax=Zobellella iuensis TaxID=2803811 RepID=A0ABS1QPC4_9GAMM|nr:hypothetical protein [Zobellella iuensis]MBL1376336.1 hypothetical protein [Zobellella iuensis]
MSVLYQDAYCYQGKIMELYRGPAISELDVRTAQGMLSVFVASRLIDELALRPGLNISGDAMTLCVRTGMDDGRADYRRKHHVDA